MICGVVLLLLYFKMDQNGDNGWKACQQPDAEPLKLTVEFRCLGPGANIMMDLRGERRDRLFYRFCKVAG
jgi:hypothetical protein